MSSEELEWCRNGVCTALFSPSSSSSSSLSGSDSDSDPSSDSAPVNVYSESSPSSSSFSSSASVDEELGGKFTGALVARGVGSSGVTVAPRVKFRRGGTGLLCGAIC